MTVKEALILTGSTEKEAEKHEKMGATLESIEDCLQQLIDCGDDEGAENFRNRIEQAKTKKGRWQTIADGVYLIDKEYILNLLL